MNTEQIVTDNEPLQEEAADEAARARESAYEAFAPLDPPKTRLGALMKAIEIWVQTR